MFIVTEYAALSTYLCAFYIFADVYNSFLVYCRELASGTVSLTGGGAQGDDSKHDSHYTELLINIVLFYSYSSNRLWFFLGIFSELNSFGAYSSRAFLTGPEQVCHLNCLEESGHPFDQKCRFFRI